MHELSVSVEVMILLRTYLLAFKLDLFSFCPEDCPVENFLVLPRDLSFLTVSWSFFILQVLLRLVLSFWEISDEFFFK